MSFVDGDLNYSTAVLQAISYDTGMVTINNSGATGDVHFALAEGGRSPSGVILRITFKITGSSGSNAFVSFSNGEVLSLSSWDGYNQNVLGGTTGASVTVQ